MIPADKLANADQVATAVISTVADGAAAGSRAVDIRVWNGIDVRLLPDRGLDIGAAWFRGVPLAWISPGGRAAAAAPRGARGERLAGRLGRRARHDVRPLERRRRSEGHGQHGTYTARAAADLQVERTTAEVTATGTVVDAPFTLVPPHRHQRRPGARPHRRPGRQRLRVDGGGAAALPRQPRRTALGRGRLPRDGCAGGRPRDEACRSRARRRGTSRRRRPTERRSASSSTSAHRGRASTSPRLGVELTVRSSLPRLWQWVDPASGTYALGLEPANCSVLGREHDIATGRMPFLDPGEARTSWLTIAARPL